jgi:hypothetical protein
MEEVEELQKVLEFDEAVAVGHVSGNDGGRGKRPVVSLVDEGEAAHAGDLVDDSVASRAKIKGGMGVGLGKRSWRRERPAKMRLEPLGLARMENATVATARSVAGLLL